jgi:hypothetical protein
MVVVQQFETHFFRNGQLETENSKQTGIVIFTGCIEKKTGIWAIFSCFFDPNNFSFLKFFQKESIARISEA